jgi:predicted nucleic acid-binding protein
MPRTLIVDANPLLSALLGGAALPILCDPDLRFITTEKTTWEVKKYLPVIVEKLNRAGKTAWTEARLERLFHQLPVAAFGDDFYGSFLPEAKRLIGTRDAEDVDLLALTLQTKLPLWTEDHDFDEITGIMVIRTSELIISRQQ